MAERKKPSRAERSALSRKAEERASLASAAAAYTTGLGQIAKGVASLARGSRSLDAARKAADSPELAQYGLAARLRPAVLQRAVHSMARDLESKVRAVRSADVSVPDGEEGPYLKLLGRLSAASDAVSEALREFGQELPERPGAKVHPAVRDLILSSAKVAAQLNRTLGKTRSAAPVHVAAVAAEIASSGNVSFY